jgi:hypothetical protein
VQKLVARVGTNNGQEISKSYNANITYLMQVGGDEGTTNLTNGILHSIEWLMINRTKARKRREKRV